MRKSLTITAGILLIPLLLILLAMVALESAWFSGYLSDRLSDQIGRQVTWREPDIDWSLHPTVSVHQFRIDNPDWTRHKAMAKVDAIEIRFSLPALLEGMLLVEKLSLHKPMIHLARSEKHGANWTPLLSGQTEQAPLLKLEFDEIAVQNGELSYLAPWHDTDIAVQFDSVRDQRFTVTGNGLLQGHPVTVDITADPIAHAVSQSTPYTLKGRLGWRDHQLNVDGEIQAVTRLDDIQFNFSLQGPSADALAEVFGYNSRAAPYQLQARVQHQPKGRHWSISDLDGHLGDSEIKGSLAYDRSGSKPKLTTDLQITALDLDKTAPVLTKENDTPQKKKKAPLSWSEQLKQWMRPLRQYEADINLQLGQLQLPEHTLQDLVINLNVAQNQLTIESLAFAVAGGQVKITGHVTAAEKFPEGRLMVNLDRVDLGDVLAHYGYRHLGLAKGKLAATFKDDNLTVANSKLRYWEPDQNTDITASLEPRRTSKGEAGIKLTASGQLRNRRLQVDLLGGPLLDLDNPNKSYPVDVSVDFGATKVAIEGTVTQPLHLKDVDLHVQASGPDPAHLYYLTGIDFPSLPPYDVKADLTQQEASWYLRNLDGRVGDSDLSGNLRWQLDQTPMLSADLYSQKLDFDDLGPLVGAAPDTGTDETASPEQQQLAQQQQQDKDTLPEQGLLQRRLQIMNARVNYEAERVQAGELPLDKVHLDLRIKDGVLRMQPLRLAVGSGKVTSQLTLNGTTTPPTGHIQMELSQVGLHDLMAPFPMAANSRGIIGGRGSFRLQGNSVSAALAHLQGEARLAMDSGELDATLVEAIGLDAGQLLLNMLGDEEPYRIQCAYMDLHAQSGVVDVEALTIATVDSNIVGDGTVDFANEKYELILEAQPKDFSVLTASSPVRIYGALNEVNVDVVSAEFLGGAVLAGLGAAVFPPAALLPLLELGTTSGQGGCHSAKPASKQQDDV